MNKPADPGNWADTGDVVEPTSDKRDAGWVTGEYPPAQYLNWLANLTFQWTQFIDEFFSTAGTVAENAKLTGTLTVAGDVTVTDDVTAKRVTAVNTTTPPAGDPIFNGYDELGNRRWMIDWNGFPTGMEMNQVTEQWRTSGTTEPTGWSWGTAGNGTRSYDAPVASRPYRHVTLDSGTTGGGDSLLSESLYIARMSADICYTQEWVLQTGAAIDSGDAAQISVGIQHAHGGADDYFIGFYFDKDVDGEWQARTVGSATVDTDTGVTVAINTEYRMRVEILGDTLHAGSNFLGRWWINGTLVAERTFSSPGVDNIRRYFRIVTPGADGPYIMYIGPVQSTWNNREGADFV